MRRSTSRISGVVVSYIAYVNVSPVVSSAARGSDGRHAEDLDARRSVLEHDRGRRRRRARRAQVDRVGVERDVVGVRRRRRRLVLTEQRLHVVRRRHAAAAAAAAGVGRRRARADTDRAVGGRRAPLTTLLADAAAAAAQTAAAADAQLGDVPTERRRHGEEDERAGGEERVVEEVDDGAGEQDRRTVGDRALAGESRVGDQQERVEREARQQEDGVRDADRREGAVQLARGGRVDVARLPRVVDLTQLVGASPALRQQLHGAREHDEVRQHLTDDEARRGHGQARDVAPVPVGVDAERARVGESVDADPVRRRRVLDERVRPDDVDVEETDDEEERGDDAMGSRQLTDRRQSLRSLVDARRLGSHQHRQPRAEMDGQVRHVRVDLHISPCSNVAPLRYVIGCTLTNPQDLDPDCCRPVYSFSELRYMRTKVKQQCI